MRPPAPDDVRGRQMGNYEVLCRLSAGGMAEIFLASKRGLAGFHKPVVLKKILPDIQGQEDFVQMFLDEARVTAAFNHPNIAQVFDLDVAGDELFLAMEFVPGATLLEVARACLTAKEPMPVGFGLASVRDTALALHYAHTFTDTLGEPSPVIHRDVAEKNIMVTYEGVTKLLDFGIAKSLAEVSRTQVGMVKGTSGYMSPEQILGAPLDARSDLFSLGVVLHECITGRRLFPGKAPAAVVNAVLRGPIPEPSRLNPEVPPELDAIVLKALARKREERYATTLEFARELERTVGPLIWLPEQSGELLRRLFADRREQTRQVLASGRAPTSEMKLAPPTAAPAPRLPTISATPAQSLREPTAEATDIVPYNPLARPPGAPVNAAAAPGAGASARAPVRPPPPPEPTHHGRTRPGRTETPPRTEAPPRSEPPPDEPAAAEEAPERTAIVRPRRTTTSAQERAPTGDMSSRRVAPPRPAPLPTPLPQELESEDDATRPIRRLPLVPPRAPSPAPQPAVLAPPPPDQQTEPALPVLPRATPRPRPAPHKPPEPPAASVRAPLERTLLQEEPEDEVQSSGAYPIAPAPSRRGPRVAALVGVLVLLAGAALFFLLPRASKPEASAVPPPVAAPPEPAPDADAPPAPVAPAPAEEVPTQPAPASEASAPDAPAPDAPAVESASPEASAKESTPRPKAGAPPRPRREASPSEAPAPVEAAAAGTPEAPPEVGLLTLRTDPYAQVFLGRRELGTTPLFNVKLPVGSHTLRLVGPDKKSWKLPVEITSEQPTSIARSLGELSRE